MPDRDQTKELLELMLSQVHQKQALAARVSTNDSCLVATNNQFLGRITENRFDSSSILNLYGPFGSKYSATSIFNPYSPYGSVYGMFSVNNPMCQTPPKLFIRGREIGLVTKNRQLRGHIETDQFIWSLRNDLRTLMAGNVSKDELQSRASLGQSFIIANDGTFLGDIGRNIYAPDSIFNVYGAYGSRYSPNSIYNPYGSYGNIYSVLSPFNSLSSTPPKIYVRGQFRGFLSKNTTIPNRVDPDRLREWAEQNA